MAKIPDISHYHPVSNWSTIKTNAQFLISKATQGTSYIDSTLDSFIDGCEKYKIPYFLYVFLNKGDELLQAKYMVTVCKKKVGSYFRGYVLDVEANNNASDIKEALTYVSKQSAKCMIYTMYSQYSKYKDVIDNRPSNCAWWEARYGQNNGSYSATYPCHSGADLHQYTSKGKCDGISGSTIDLNRLTGSKALTWFTASSTSQTTSKTAETAYYGKYKGTSKRIDTVLKKIGVPSTYRGSYTKRKPIAKANGISNYIGSASQNLGLIAKAKKGKLKKV